MCGAVEVCIHLIVVPISMVKDSSVNPVISETITTGSGTGVSVGRGRGVGIRIRVLVGASLGVLVRIGSGVLVLSVGLFTGVIPGVESGFAFTLAVCSGHAILVHPRTLFVQKQLLQKLIPVSFPVQPIWTVSPPVSWHTGCVELGVAASEADKVVDAFT